MNLPQFPEFKKIELHDKQTFDTFTKNYPPYSDFNFVSLWSWNIDEEIEYCFLNDNLIVKLNDYVDNKPLLTFLGQHKTLETIDNLLKFSEENLHEPKLKLLPQDNFSHTDFTELTSKYNFSEDHTNFDYILKVSNVALMSGQKLKQKRKLLNRFLRNHGEKVEIKYMDINEIRANLLDFYHHWTRSKTEKELNNNEFHAIKRLLTHYHFFNTIVMSVHYENSLIGFTLFEELSKYWALSSFQKGDIRFEGIYEFLNHNLALHLQKKEIKYVNIEQDLGVEGLRRAKMDYNPTFLKKYSLSKKSTN